MNEYKNAHFLHTAHGEGEVGAGAPALVPFSSITLDEGKEREELEMDRIAKKAWVAGAFGS